MNEQIKKSVREKLLEAQNDLDDLTDMINRMRAAGENTTALEQRELSLRQRVDRMRRAFGV